VNTNSAEVAIFQATRSPVDRGWSPVFRSRIELADMRPTDAIPAAWQVDEISTNSKKIREET